MIRRPRLHRSASLDAQLRAQALAADRANKPTMLVMVGWVMVGAGLIYLVLGATSLRSKQSTLRIAQEYALEVNTLITQINEHSSTDIDLASLYPRRRAIEATIQERITELGLQFKQPPTIRAPREQLVSQSARIFQVSVTCQFTTAEPLETILGWIDGILHYEQLEGQAFISQVRLSPAGLGWQGSFDVSLYEHRR